MASVSSVNSTSSLYNSANIISGLASGMDTESMIENLVQSYQTKIQNLTNQATKIGWKQDSYRSIISKLVAFTNNYTSYTSSTNLLSSSFFSSAVKVAPQGVYASKVTASGRTESDIKLNSVSQLATAARFQTNAAGLKEDGGNFVTASGALNMEDNVDLSYLSGSLAFKYGSQTVSISFDEIADQIDNGDSNKAQTLKKMIEDKLKDQTITLSNGTTVSAGDRIGVEVDSNGTFTFKDKSGAGNSVSISSASESITNVLNLGDMSDSENPLKSFKVTDSTNFTYQKKAYEYISEKSININVDGETVSLKMPQIKKDSDGNFTLTMPSTVKDQYGNTSTVYDTSKLDKSKYTIVKEGEQRTGVSSADLADAYTDMMNNSVKAAFGSRLTVSNTASGTGELNLQFEVKDGSNLLINTSVGETLGIGKTATNYLNTSNTLADLMTDEAKNGLTPAKDANGNDMEDDDGNKLYDFKINDVLIGRYTMDTKLSQIISDINGNSEANVKVSYSQTTREFVFNSTKTGSENQIKMDDGLAKAIFGSTEASGDEANNKFGDAYGMSGLAPSDLININVKAGGQNIHFEMDGISGSDTIEDVANKLNDIMGTTSYNAVYNKNSGQLEITDENGKKLELEMFVEDPYLGKIDLEFDESYAPAASNYTPGQDAVFEVEVNGTVKQLTRGSNSVQVDGLTINFKGTFDKDDEGGEPVTFETSTDSDKIVDAVKNMLAEYNVMMAEIREAYATMPYQNSSGAFQSYEPLTDEDRATMSESAIQAYEAKAKQGILFGDSNLRSLYENLRSVFQPSGSDSALLSKIGINVTFSSVDNSTTITLDENKLREALDDNPDEVADLFTRVGQSGVSNNGIMQGLKTQLDRYAGLTGSVKGILIQQAGTPLNSLSLLDNQWQKELDSLASQVEKWQDKMTSQVDRYTSMFSKLELLINQMNSQSATLAGMLGG